MAFVIAEKKMNRTISRLPGVRGHVRKHAMESLGRAKRTLALHRDTGNASVSVVQGKTDCLLILSDPPSIRADGSTDKGNAMAIEFGHSVVIDGNVVGYRRGLRIISSAAGL